MAKNNFLANQKIKKRRRYTPVTGIPGRKSSKKAAFRPAGIVSLSNKNSRLIDSIKQEPQANRDSLVRRSFVPRQKVPVQSPHRINNPAPKEKRHFSFSLPAIPVASLLLLGLGIFFVRGGALDWIDREVINKDQASRYNLARYAGVTPGFPGTNLSESGEETIPLDLTEVFAWHNYKVQKGDSVSKIAAAFSVSMDAIIASNGITNARTLKEGEVLRIPNMDGIPYTVKKGDSLSGISQSNGVPLEAILDANDLQSDTISAGTILFIPGARMNREDLRLALGELFIYPVRGARLSSPFGWRNDPFTGVRRHHAAVDLSAPQGTPVRAAMEGKISALGFENTYGNYIIVSHPGGYQTMYAHLHSVLVKKGDSVAQGSQIGTVGSTGYSTGPHLHFAIFRNSRAVNPLDFMNTQR
ncbi:MAG: M23 family metallopeptidase [Treponema sp.]|nr:M23 family metallopeptidase [Treponema sp.]